MFPVCVQTPRAPEKVRASSFALPKLLLVKYNHYGHFWPEIPTAALAMMRFLKHLRIALLRTLENDQFAVAKAAAYSAILTLFPSVLLIASILTASHSTRGFIREISVAIGGIMPSGTAPSVLTFFEGRNPAPVRMIVTTSLITLWTGSGVMISWMEGFRRAYQMPPRLWNLTTERMVSFLLVFLAGLPMAFASFLLAFGNQIQHWLAFHANRELDLYLLATWTVLRWLIAVVTTVAVIALIYHHGLPRTQPWHRVLPGSMLATGLWIASTTIFGWYLRHYADYGVIYGSVGTAIALLIWLYIVSLVILIGAEFNAVRYPRYLFGTFSKLESDPAAGERNTHGI
jgi:membrane protein